MRLMILMIMSVLINFNILVLADEEASNVPYVKSSEYGRVYAKSIPDEYYGLKGKTLVYAVNRDADKILYTFDWYSNQIFLLDSVGSVVRLGPWARGQAPSADDLAIAFYLDGKKTKEYSTSDIVRITYQDPSHVGNSVSHYTVFNKISGFRWIRSNKWVFDVETHENKVLSFDVSTGELQSDDEKNQDEIVKKISDLKMEWFSNNRDLTKKDEYNYKLSEEQLKTWAKDRYPQIPKGYKVNIGNFFEEVKLESINQ